MSHTDDAPIFDRDALLRMVAGNEKLAKSVIQTFFEQADSLFVSIDDAMAGGDPDTIVAALHKMGGSAKTIGATRLGTVCIDTEHTLAEEKNLTPAILHGVNEAQTIYRSTRAEMEDFLAES